MSDTQKCFMCDTNEGNTHPISGKAIEKFVANNKNTAYICFECLTRCAAIMTSGEKFGSTVKPMSSIGSVADELSIRGAHEPLVYAEEHIPPKTI